MTYLDLSKADLYDQLGEEATELAHACLKMARKLRGTNPTPLSEKDISQMVKEELSDVLGVAAILDIKADCSLIEKKFARWNECLNHISKPKNRFDVP